LISLLKTSGLRGKGARKVISKVFLLHAFTLSVVYEKENREYMEKMWQRKPEKVLPKALALESVDTPLGSYTHPGKFSGLLIVIVESIFTVNIWSHSKLQEKPVV
jgi:hypothetical protein